MSWLIDASVVVKWIITEEDSDRAASWQGLSLAAPELLLIELASILWKKARQGQVTPPQALAGLTQVEAVIELLPTRGLEARALEIAIELQHSIYDCLYLALAETLHAKIVTADRKLVRACMSTAFEGVVQPLDQGGIDPF